MKDLKAQRTTTRLGGALITFDAACPRSLAIPMDLSDRLAQPRAFGLSAATQTPLELDELVTEVSRGGPFNCMKLELWPHGNGTHTETVGHLLLDPPPIGALHFGFQLCALVSVTPEGLGASTESYPKPALASDRVLTQRTIAGALDALEKPLSAQGGALPLTALALRTLPNDEEQKRRRDYSSTNPPYMTREAMRFVRHELQIEHLLLDLPSVDREEDHGQLCNHHVYWDVPSDGVVPHSDERTRCTITELILAPDELRDGVYVLQLELPALLTDAAPSRPVLYAILP